MVHSLSIVIPSHNRSDLLRACLASVTCHAPDGAEVIVVDDASHDGVVSTAAAEFSGVRCLRLPRRCGFCTAANAGIYAARHEIIELLNDDTKVSAGWATAAMEAFDAAKVAAVAPLVLMHPGTAEHAPIIDSAGDRYYVGGVAAKRGHGQLLGPGHLQRRRVFGASASAAFYRRDVLLRVGAFPDSFGAYFEDVDLSFRLHWAGYDVVFEPRSRVYHRVSASYGRPRWRLLEQQSRNEERVFWRNLPVGVLARTLPRHLAVLAAKAWRRVREGSLLPFVFGRLRVAGEFPELLRHRLRLRGWGPGTVETDWQLDQHFWGQ